MNGFLPANIGTFVTLFMFVTIIPSCTFGGSIAAYLVQKIFFTIAGTFVYLYMFLSVPGAFDVSFGRETSHPGRPCSSSPACRRHRRARADLLALREEALGAGQAGRGDPQPAQALSARAFLPSFFSWSCKLIVIGIFLAAFAIPVTFESIMWVAGSVYSRTPCRSRRGRSASPRRQMRSRSTNAAAYPYHHAVDYSTAQQLIITAWNQVVALVLVCVVFGWTGGKQLVGDS